VINWVISVPIMFVMMRMVAHPKIMGKFVVGQRLDVLGWLATSVMALAVATMLAFLIL
jgi:Mn2+/Fe2+ NRAMP family transporter